MAKTFKVRLTETAVYFINVKAKNEAEAVETAEEIFVQSDGINAFFSHVEDRDAEVLPRE